MGKHGFMRSLRRDAFLYFLLLVPILVTLIYRYIPMAGIIVAFKDFKISNGFWGSPWVGLKWFEKVFKGPSFLMLLKNTLLLSFWSLLIAFPAPIILALSINESKFPQFKRVVQTTSYLPHFISTVIAVGIIGQILNPSTGIVNRILETIGIEPIMFMVKPFWFRPIYITLIIWQGIGYSSIVYLAALTAIDPELYDAAEIDGAGRCGKIMHVVMPGIAPTIVILLILQIGGILNVGFEQVLLLYHPLTLEVADVIDTFVYRRGLISYDISYATAMGLFKSVVGLIMIAGANKLSRRISENSLW